MTTNEVLLLKGTQWLGQGLVAKRKGLGQNRLMWLRGTEYCNQVNWLLMPTTPR